MVRQAFPAIVTVLALASSGALAGVVVTSTTRDFSTQQTSPTIAYADTDKLKVVTAENTIIYRADQNKAWIVNPAQMNYVELTPETMQQLGGRFAGAQAQLQQQLAGLPPAQRAQIEALLAARGGAGGPPGLGRGGPPAAQGSQVTYTRAGASKTVANIRCDTYRKTMNGALDEDVCIARIAAAGLGAADFHVLESFSTFMEPVASMPQVPRNDYLNWNAMNQAIGFLGMPIDTIHYANGAASKQDTVQRVERVAIPANTFELPAGFVPRTFGPAQ